MSKHEINRVRMLRIHRPASIERGTVETPNVEPRVTPEQALEAINRFDGGKEIIELLESEVGTKEGA